MMCTRLFPVMLLCAVLSACGGSSGTSPAPGGFSVTPLNPSVAAGSTQQFTTSGGSGGTITWQVNGTTGGSSSSGTISSDGLYTAPKVPPVSQPVTITAVQGSTTASSSVSVTYSSQSLNGSYIFSFDGVQVSSDRITNAVGTLMADGNGGITGTEDVNGPGGYFSTVPVTGTYTLSANGQGTLTLDGGSAGTLSMTVTLVAGAAEGILTDAGSGNIGGGNLLPQSGTVNYTSDLSNANYTISLSSNSLPNSDNSAGVLALSGGSVTSGYMDENNNGTYTQSGTVSGSYAASGGNNRGTLSLTVGASTSHYVFYAVSPTQLKLMCIDTGCTSGGELDQQTSVGVTAGNYVYSLLGSGTGASPDAMLVTGSMTPTSSTAGSANFTIYENNNGSYQSIIGGTTYTTNATTTPGRGLMTLPTPIKSRNFVFYVQDAGDFNVLETSSGFGNTSGFALATQSNAAAVSGEYGLLILSQTVNTQSISTGQATLQITSTGQVSGQEVLNANGSVATIAVSGTLTASKTPGTYTLTLNYAGGQTVSYVLAAAAPGVLTGISTDQGASVNVGIASLLIQHTTS